MKKMRIAIIGQGRSGRDIHGEYVQSGTNDTVELVAVVEALPERRERAKREYGPDVDVYSDYRELFGRTDIDLVVNASFSYMHYPIAKDLLSHGFNVLNEKPFARTYYECMDLIRTAKENNVIISAFHQTLYDPLYLKVKEIMQSGILGDPQQINLRYSGFARRWDWQTLQSFCGGSVYNSGPHPIGQALDLLNWADDVEVKFSSYRTLITSGDAEDYGKIILAGADTPVVDLEIIAADAFPGDKFKIIGSKGTLTANGRTCTIRYIEPEKLEPRPVTTAPLCKPDGCPAYCTEQLEMQTAEYQVTGTSFDSAVHQYYTMLRAAVLDGAPLRVTPEMAAKVIAVIEKGHVDNPLPVRF